MQLSFVIYPFVNFLCVFILCMQLSKTDPLLNYNNTLHERVIRLVIYLLIVVLSKVSARGFIALLKPGVVPACVNYYIIDA